MKKVLGLILVLTIFLSGCIQYSEHISLNREGSGIFTLKMGVMDTEGMLDGEDVDEVADTLAEDAESLEGYRGVVVLATANYVADGFIWSEMTLEFESLNALLYALENEEVSVKLSSQFPSGFEMV